MRRRYCRRARCLSSGRRPRSIAWSAPVDAVANGAAQRHDAAVEMPGRMHAVGQQRPGAASGEVDPEACAREAGVADGVLRAIVAARPADIGPLPAMRALVAERRADQRIALAAEQAGVTGAVQRIAFLVVDLAADDAAAPGVLLGRSGMHWVGKPGKPRTGVHLADGALLQSLECDAEEDEVEVGIDRGSGRPIV